MDDQELDDQGLDDQEFVSRIQKKIERSTGQSIELRVDHQEMGQMQVEFNREVPLVVIGANVFHSMDGDNNGRISRSEFMKWDWGYFYLAEQKGQSKKHNAVKRILFALRDRNNDGRIERKEMRISVFTDFRRADLNHDGVLSEAEFLNAWTPIIVMKAAHKSW